MNVPGESTLRREFLRLQQENKSNSEALKQQQQQLQQQQQRDPEAHIKHLLHQRQRRIEEQKEERRRVEEVGLTGRAWSRPSTATCAGPIPGSLWVAGRRGSEQGLSHPFHQTCVERLCPLIEAQPLGRLSPSPSLCGWLCCQHPFKQSYF